MKHQLNVELPQPIIDRVRADAKKSGRPINTVMLCALSDFLDSWKWKERLAFYEKHPVKRAGRPVEMIA